MKKAVFLLVFLLAPLLVFAEPHWEYAKQVEYKDWGDPYWISFMDDTAVTIANDHSGFENLDSWLPGRLLTIGYNEKLGAVLYDPQNGHFERILEGLQPHPIDLMAKDCYDHVCRNDLYRRWNVELNRSLKSYIAGIHSSHVENAAALEKKILTAHAQWLKFRDAQFIAINEIYNRQGTIWSSVAARHKIDVIREQALRYGVIEAW